MRSFSLLSVAALASIASAEPLWGWDWLHFHRTRDSASVTLPGLRSLDAHIDNGVARWTVQYATAERFGHSDVVRSDSGYDSTALPPACPQASSFYASNTSEDCLYAVVYAPYPVPKNLPVLVWIHGGSNVYGSASAPGLDGSTLAREHNIVVVVLQYRLGILGLPPTPAPQNLALEDILLALKEVQVGMKYFGGDANKVTIAGQSSGATYVRTLLSTPSASKLFRSAIMQSDPTDYSSYQSTALAQSTSAAMLSALNCSDVACLSALSVNDILSAQASLQQSLPGITGVPLALPFRPTLTSGGLISGEIASSSFSELDSSKPLLIMTVRDEAGPTIAGMSSVPLPSPYYVPIVTQFLGSDRAQTVLASGAYAVSSGLDGVRDALNTLGTDYVWRAPTHSLAKMFVGRGHPVFVGEFTAGWTYPSNANTAFCAGKVCHEDDIYLTFGTTPGTSSLAKEVTARWAAFVSSSNPNTRQYSGWTKASSADLRIRVLGDGKASDAAPPFWGGDVPYDWQLYG